MSKKKKYYFKFLPKNLRAFGGFVWPKVDEWTDKVYHVEVCRSGYHMATLRGLGRWSNNGSQLFLCEGRGDMSKRTYSDDKVAFAQARLVRKLDTRSAKLKPLWLELKRAISKYNKEVGVAHGLIYFSGANTGDAFERRNFFDSVHAAIRCAEQPDPGYDGPRRESRKLSIKFLRRLQTLWKLDFGLPRLKGRRKAKGRKKVVT
jgi:hypothetical protein